MCFIMRIYILKSVKFVLIKTYFSSGGQSVLYVRNNGGLYIRCKSGGS